MIKNYMDIPTLTFMTGIVFIILFITFLYVYSSRKTYSGFSGFLFASFSGCCGFLLLALRGFVPDFFSYALSNVLLIMFMVLISYGIDKYSGKAHNIWFYAVPVIVMFLVHVFLLLYTPLINPKTVANSLIGIIICIYTIRRLHRDIRAMLGDPNWYMITALVILGCWFAVRSIYALFTPPVVDVTTSPVQRWSLIVYTSCAICIMIGIILINSQRIEHDLVQSAAEIKILRGIFPICASCKKIRDDRGYWNQLEAYIRDHSEAEFSHSLCPDCAAKLYPELFKVKDKKNPDLS